MSDTQKYYLLRIALFIFCCVPCTAQAKEVIRTYHSQIYVQNDGSLLVNETIEVTAEGKKIKRGIYRDFPLHRRTFLGGMLSSEYNIVSITKDGISEPWHTEIKDGGVYRLYIGASNVFLKNGVYRYDIRYKIPKQVFFFDNYDELYWNAIGTGWDFQILKGSAEIILPNGANIKSYSAYTGKALSKAQNFTATQSGTSLYVETTIALNPHEGLTIAVSLPKGYMTEQADMVGMAFFWKQHRGLSTMLIGLFILSLYYYAVWKRFGVDPKTRGLAPFYDAPDGISPAMASVIHTMGDADSKKCMTAALISLAAKGYLTIEETSAHHYKIMRTDKPEGEPAISEDEHILFKAVNGGISISRSSEKLVKPAQEHRQKLTELCHKIYFFKNTWWWAGGFLITLQTLLVFGAQNNATEEFWIGLLFTFVFGLISSAAIFHGIKQIITAPPAQKFGAFFFVVWGAGFSIGGWMGLYLLSQHISWLILPVIVAMFTLIIKMRYIMKAPTRKGREVMDHVNGLKYYMEAVEEKVLKKFDPPEMSRELYETYLPYAVALGVESKWADKFAATIGSAPAEAYRMATTPHWYHGSAYSSSGTRFSATNMINNFSSTLSAASTSNSSGSSGGGSSGGGGGGGGGGGW